jgi:hypothetical protein
MARVENLGAVVGGHPGLELLHVGHSLSAHGRGATRKQHGTTISNIVQNSPGTTRLGRYLATRELPDTEEHIVRVTAQYDTRIA